MDLLSYYGKESQSFSLRDGYLVVSATWILTVILGPLPFLGSGILVNVFDALFEATSGITATGATIINSVDDFTEYICIMAWTYELDWWDGDYRPYFILLEKIWELTQLICLMQKLLYQNQV